jgi:hypothetical protein
VNSIFTVHEVSKKVRIATLLEEEKEKKKIAKFNLLVKVAFLPEMTL